MANESGLKKNRRTLILLFVVLCAPIIASYTLYFFGVRPGATVNYGELLQVKPLAGTALNQADQTIFRMRQFAENGYGNGGFRKMR